MNNLDNIKDNYKSGWIKLYRSIENHWIFPNKRPFTEFEAWVMILMKCNHSGEKVKLGYDILECKRGEKLYSLKTWSELFFWNISKTRRFFKLLEKDSMISLKNEQKTTRLIVCNYDTYQAERNANETQTKRKRNANETQTKRKRKQLKNDKNDKNDNNNLPENSFSDDVIEIYNFSLKYFPKELHPKNPANWHDVIDKLIRLDKKLPREICEIIKFARTDDFWSSNFLSLVKLRNKDKTGVKYYDVFKNKYKSPTKNIVNDKVELFSEQEYKGGF